MHRTSEMPPLDSYGFISDIWSCLFDIFTIALRSRPITGPNPNLTRSLRDVSRAVVHDRGEVVRWRVECKPPFDLEQLLGAGDVGARWGDLHVVTVPPGVGPRSIWGEVHGTDRRAEAWAPAAEDVEVAPLEVVVASRHQPAPLHKVRHVNFIPVLVIELQGYVRVRPTADDGAGPDVDRVHALVDEIMLHRLLGKKRFGSIDESKLKHNI